MKAFKNWAPARFQVFAELTENVSGAKVKGHRYRVTLAGKRIDTLEDAKQAIADDIAANTNPDTFGGLVSWGKMAKREYAIYESTSIKRVL